MIKEYNIKILLLKDIQLKEIGFRLGKYIDNFLCSDNNWLAHRHYQKQHSSTKYCYNYLYPFAQKGIYKLGGVYNFQLRTCDTAVADIIENRMLNWHDHTFKILKIACHKIDSKANSKIIERVFTTTPVIIKNDFGYWRSKETVDFFETRIRVNMIKKYADISGEKVEEAKVFSRYSIDNNKPIGLTYKDIKLLGDKVTLYIEEDALSQAIARACLATGIGENNTRLGAGFLNYKYRR